MISGRRWGKTRRFGSQVDLVSSERLLLWFPDTNVRAEMRRVASRVESSAKGIVPGSTSGSSTFASHEAPPDLTLKPADRHLKRFAQFFEQRVSCAGIASEESNTWGPHVLSCEAIPDCLDACEIFFDADGVDHRVAVGS